MKRLFALIALVLFLGAPFAYAGNGDGDDPPPEGPDGRSVTTTPPGAVLD